jgi:DNA-binding transcriptional ArsR family regulator
VTKAFPALAHPTRRQILQELKKGEFSIGLNPSRSRSWWAIFWASPRETSVRFSILKNAELVLERREGKQVLPNWLRDRGYSLIARSRYCIFGRYNACLLAEEKYRHRFLDW